MTDVTHAAVRYSNFVFVFIIKQVLLGSTYPRGLLLYFEALFMGAHMCHGQTMNCICSNSVTNERFIKHRQRCRQSLCCVALLMYWSCNRLHGMVQVCPDNRTLINGHPRNPDQSPGTNSKRQCHQHLYTSASFFKIK